VRHVKFPRRPAPRDEFLDALDTNEIDHDCSPSAAVRALGVVGRISWSGGPQPKESQKPVHNWY